MHLKPVVPRVGHYHVSLAVERDTGRIYEFSDAPSRTAKEPEYELIMIVNSELMNHYWRYALHKPYLEMFVFML